MKKILCLLFITLSLSGFAQSRYQLFVDSLGIVVSDYIESHASSGMDSAGFMQYFTQTAKNITGSLDTLTADQRRDLPALIIFRVLHHSNLVTAYMTNKVEGSKYWTHSDEMPASSISEADLASFWTHKKFIYHDTDTSIVHLTLDQNFWIDSMADNTYSKLSVQKLNNQTFQSTFIKSNNKIKRLASIPGDIYHYQILEKSDHSYKVATHMNGISTYFIFELEY